MLEVTSSTTDTVRAMEHCDISLRISSFEGENVSTVVSQLRTDISRLTFLNKLPRDIVPELLEMFQSSSVPFFNGVPCILFFEGENMFTVVSQLCTAISRLTVLDKLPRDIVAKLLEVLQSSSVHLFNDVFRFCDLQRKID